eukprot:273946-Pyramimonas_sp.AAC.1
MIRWRRQLGREVSAPEYLNSPEQPMLETLERIAEEGPESYPGTHAASLAHDDWFRTLDQLKKAARRIYTPNILFPRSFGI